jgi:5'-phosphate synthase pdxT subunit
LPKIGVLAIQGDFLEHGKMLDAISIDWSEVKLPDQLEGLDGLIIPGGESTTIVQLMDIYGFRDAIKRRSSEGMAVWGTCAGMIVIARKLLDRRPEPLGLMNIEVSRNAFGRQVDSFETDIQVSSIEGDPIHAIFIRAPVVTNVGPEVEIIAEVEDGKPVAVKQGKLMATSFHPELTDDTRLHELFCRLSSS